MEQSMTNHYVYSAGKAAINIEEISAYRAVEEYAEAESLDSGTLVVVEGVGEFNVTKSGQGYIACQR